MKTISQIAKEAGVTYRDVYSVIIANKITPVSYKEHERYRLYAQIQIDLIHKVLYFERKCNVVILESSMNKKEAPDYDAFRKFKKETYGKIN